MNKEIEKLMLEAGYACPSMAKRAQKLAELVVQKCCAIVEDAVDLREPATTYVSTIQLRFGVTNEDPK